MTVAWTAGVDAATNAAGSWALHTPRIALQTEQ